MAKSIHERVRASLAKAARDEQAKLDRAHDVRMSRLERQDIKREARIEARIDALAAAGLTSYRAKGRYGYIMIGAHDDADAMREALRSSSAAHDLEVWDGARYVPVAA